MPGQWGRVLCFLIQFYQEFLLPLRIEKNKISWQCWSNFTCRSHSFSVHRLSQFLQTMAFIVPSPYLTLFVELRAWSWKLDRVDHSVRTFIDINSWGWGWGLARTLWTQKQALMYGDFQTQRYRLTLMNKAKAHAWSWRAAVFQHPLSRGPLATSWHEEDAAGKLTVWGQLASQVTNQRSPDEQGTPANGAASLGKYTCWTVKSVIHSSAELHI